MITFIFFIGTLTIAAVVGSFVVVHRDGYRQREECQH